MNKGWDRILVDLKGMTVQKLTAKWQNFLIALLAAVGLFILQKVKMPAAFKAIAMMVLYLVIGYQIATAIDPPNGAGSGGVTYSNERNPYALGRR